MADRAAPADDPLWCDVAASGLGVYVHIPFCSHRCRYCDFAAFSDLDDLMVPYVDRLVRELGERVRGPASTVFVGGGTPSRLGPELLGRVVAAVPVRADAEVTVEMNPESATREVVAAAVEAGANRLSFGMQSSAPHVLAFLERRHDPATVAAAVDVARSCGVTNLNLDLMFGVPGETDSDWDRTLDAALELGPDHLSCYALTVEAATPLGRDVAAGSAPAPDDDVAGERLEHTSARLADAGYTRYEVSNWSRREPCLHNLRYWSGGAYVGCGNGAHSFDPDTGTRSWNHRHPRTYVASDDPVAGRETLSDDQARDEAVMLGLRRSAGLSWPDTRPVPDALVRGGLLERLRGRIVLTDKGMALAGAVILDLVVPADTTEGNGPRRW